MNWIVVTEQEFNQFQRENNLRKVKNNGSTVSLMGDYMFADELLLNGTVVVGKQMHGQMFDEYEIRTTEEKYFNKDTTNVVTERMNQY
jgi:hypothetical protein